MKIKTIIAPLITLILLSFLTVTVLRLLPFFKPKEVVMWSEKFDTVPASGKQPFPKDWRLQKKPGTPSAAFSVEKDKKSGDTYLHMEADKASSSLIAHVGNLDLEKAPFLTWRWKVETLPAGADGRHKEKDDQAIGIYVGTGSPLNSKSVSYRWDTDTPKGAEGNCAYGEGAIKVKWFTLRNAEDAKGNQWFIEKRNIMEDFKSAWGFYPKKIYISVSCNSQYTGTKAVADLDWIEFVASSPEKEAPQGVKE